MSSGDIHSVHKSAFHSSTSIVLTKTPLAIVNFAVASSDWCAEALQQGYE